MKINEILRDTQHPFPSLEIVPPLSGISMSGLLDSIRPLMEFRPPYINVTSHRTEYEFAVRADGSYERRAVRGRMKGTEVCNAIMDSFETEAVPHVICAGASKDEVGKQLKEYASMGISNIMALRGDCTAGEKRFIPEPDGYCHADELVSAVKASEEDFCIGVGAYPEKHFEATNPEEDIEHLKHKVNCGADFIITQMFFDNSTFYSFCEKCRKAGILVPIIPGLKPISAPRQLDLLPQTFSIDIPADLSCEIRKHSSNKEMCYEIGCEWCEMQCKDLIKHGCMAVHFYTMGRQDNVKSILESCF